MTLSTKEYSIINSGEADRSWTPRTDTETTSKSLRDADEPREKNKGTLSTAFEFQRFAVGDVIRMQRGRPRKDEQRRLSEKICRLHSRETINTKSDATA